MCDVIDDVLQVDYMNYMDEIAEEIGVKPDVTKLLKEDFRLGWKVSRRIRGLNFW